MRIDLTGRVALVTGATRGIGRAIAESLAESGAAVAVVGRDAARAEAVASELGGKARGFGCDVSDVAAVVSLIASVESAMGSLDILVNNAGITRDNILPRMKDSEWSEVIDANLRGAFATTRAAVRGMMKRRWGRVINISSIVGLMGNAGQSNYAASKAGLIGFTKSVAKELGARNILANVVAPGFIETGYDRRNGGGCPSSLVSADPARAARRSSRRGVVGHIFGLRRRRLHNGPGVRRRRRPGHVMVPRAPLRARLRPVRNLPTPRSACQITRRR